MMEVREAVKRIVDKLEGATQKREFWGHIWGQNRVWGVFWGVFWGEKIAAICRYSQAFFFQVTDFNANP
ncbi:hypothetical protein [Enterobacter ludwigii]